MALGPDRLNGLRKFDRQNFPVQENNGVERLILRGGNNRKFFPRMINMGFACIQAIDPCGGLQDIYELKTLYGDRLALHGGIDCEHLISGTPGDIRADVVEHVERLGVGGGYVCSSSHDLNERMPMENIRAMAETIHTCRRDFH